MPRKKNRKPEKEPIRAEKIQYLKFKNRLKGINSTLEVVEEHVSDLEDRVMENNQTKQQKEKRKNAISLRELHDITKHNNIIIIGIPDGEERKRGGT